MKILHVVSGMQKASGVTTFVENVVEELRALGHEVDVLTKDNSPSSVYHLSFIDYHSYDIVHLHGLWDPWLHKIVRSITHHLSFNTYHSGSNTRPRLVWSTHGMTAPWSMRHKWWKKFLYWHLVQKPDLKRAALIHSTVEQEAEWNRALGLVERSIIVPLGTHLPENSFNAGAFGTRKIRPDLNAYAPSASQPDDISTSGLVVSDFSQRSVNGAEGAEVRYPPSEASPEGKPIWGAKGYVGIPTRDPEEELPARRTLLFVGRIYPVKALDRLIEAFARANVPGWRLRLVGPDQSGHTAELIALCNRLGLSWTKTGAECQVPRANSKTGAECRSRRACEGRAAGEGIAEAQPRAETPRATFDTIGRNADMPSGCEADGALGIQVSPNFACREATCVQKSPQVEFAGPKFGPDLSAEYAACDILALVSHTENFGATVVDALAHAKPVITSTNTPWREVTGCVAEDEGSPSEGGAVFRGGSRGGASDVRSDNSPDATANSPAGWWVDNDVDTLTSCLRSALTTPPSTLAQMGASGRSLVESKYTWRAVASRLSTAYAEIVGCR